MDRVVEQFLNLESPDETMRMAGYESSRHRPLTIGETLLEMSAPEHVAAIVRTASGGYRLGPVVVSEAGDWSRVNLGAPPMTKGEQWVGAIHGHRGTVWGSELVQSNLDLKTARSLGLTNQWPTGGSSLVVGPSGGGRPVFGLIEFKPLPRPGTLTTVRVVP